MHNQSRIIKQLIKRITMAPKKHSARKSEPLVDTPPPLPSVVLALLGSLFVVAGAVALWGLYEMIRERPIDRAELLCGKEPLYLTLLLGCSLIALVLVISNVCDNVHQFRHKNRHRGSRPIPTIIYTKVFLIVSFIVVLVSLHGSAASIERERVFCKEVAELGQTLIPSADNPRYYRTSIYAQVGKFLAYNLQNQLDEIYIMYGRKGIGMTTAIKNNFYNLLKISHNKPEYMAFIYYADLHEIDQFLELNEEVCLFNFFKSVARTGSGLPKFSHNIEQGTIPLECTMQYLRDQIVKLTQAGGHAMFLIDGLDKITNYLNFLEMFKSFMKVSQMTNNSVRFLIFSNAMHQQLLFKLSHDQIKSSRATNPPMQELEAIFDEIVNIDRNSQEIDEGFEQPSQNHQVLQKIRAAKGDILALCETFEEVRTLVEEIEFFMLGQQNNNLSVATVIDVIKQKVYERELSKLDGPHWQQVLCLVLDKDESLKYYEFPRDMYIYLLVNFHILFSNVEFETKLIDVVLREKYYPNCCKAKFNPYSTVPFSYEYRNCSSLFTHAHEP